jgi:NADH-quinone oxidoreductase subunit G
MYVGKKITETAAVNPEKIGGIIGQFVDLESTIMFKKFLNQLGVTKICTVCTPLTAKAKQINVDFRSNYLFNVKLAQIGVGPDAEEYDKVLLIGSNPRYEASILNLRLRQRVMGVASPSSREVQKNLKINITNIGCPVNLTYPNGHEGAQMNTLYLLAQGKNILAKNLMKAKTPICIIGTNAIQRKDGHVIKAVLNQAFDY